MVQDAGSSVCFNRHLSTTLINHFPPVFCEYLYCCLSTNFYTLLSQGRGGEEELSALQCSLFGW